MMEQVSLNYSWTYQLLEMFDTLVIVTAYRTDGRIGLLQAERLGQMDPGGQRSGTREPKSQG